MSHPIAEPKNQGLRTELPPTAPRLESFRSRRLASSFSAALPPAQMLFFIIKGQTFHLAKHFLSPNPA